MRSIPRTVIAGHLRPWAYLTVFLSLWAPVSALNAFAQEAQNAAHQEVSPSQDATSPKDIPVFHSESRQVLVGGTVCGGAPRIGEDEPDLFFRCHALRGRTRKDFHVFDNGIEQDINYVAEIAWGQDTRFFHWFFNSTGRGTWLTFGDPSIRRPSAVYLLGYVPAAITTGKCHTVKVSVRGGYMFMGRNRYCNLSNPELSEATQESTPLGAEMREFASSSKPGTIEVSVKTYVFRSTGIVQLPLANSVPGDTKVAAPAFNYVVEARDRKAPARVVVSTEFVSPQIKREYRHRECVLGLYILGMVYAADGKLVAQFGDTLEGWRVFADSGGCEHYSIPRLYDTQVDLSPGTYELRVVVTDGKGNFGKARVPVRVDYLGGELLSMSDLVLTDIFRDASEMLQDFGLSLESIGVKPTPLVSSGIQFFPSFLHSSPHADYSAAVGVRRLTHGGDETGTFTKHDAVSLYLEIYDPLLEKENTEVQFEVRVTNLSTGKVKINTGPMNAAKSVQKGNAAVPVAVGLDMKMLHKGSYRLEVRAFDSAGRQTAWKATEFTMR